MKISTASMPIMAARTPCADRIGAQRRTDGALFQILDARRQRARAQNHGQIFGLLLGEAAVDAALIVNLFLDDGNFLHLVVEHDRELVADVRAGEGCETPSAFAGQQRSSRWTAIFVAARHRRRAGRGR